MEAVIKMYIRVDENSVIATGHVMRCLAIADAFKIRGEDVVFVTADRYPEKIINLRGYKIICLDSVWNDMDTEIEKIKEAIDKYSIDILLIDSYYVTQNYLAEIRKCTKVIYIDDMGKMKMDADIVINYANPDIVDYNSLYNGADTKLLTGYEYTPLRREFSNRKYHYRLESKKVLLTTGGTDKYSVEYKVADYVIKSASDIELYIIVGRYNRDYDRISMMQNKYPDKIKVFYNIDNMADIISDCDIAISAGGTTLFELCACKIPTICFAFADNQIGLTNIFGKKEVMINVGDIRDDITFGVKKILMETLGLLQNDNKRQSMSVAMSELTDGNGAMKIADEILRRCKK